MIKRVLNFLPNRVSIAPGVISRTYTSTTVTFQKQANQVEDKKMENQHSPLGLPAPDPTNPTQLQEGGTTFKLDDLGPVVVNEDGTISRIDNWKEMTEIERKNVNRILLKRNKERLERLKAQEMNQ